MCGLALGDDPIVPDESFMPPVKIWTSGAPAGDAYSDTRFTQIIRWNLVYGSDSDGNINNGIAYPTNRSGEKIADTIAYKIHEAGLTSGRIAISLIYTSLGNINVAAGTPSTASRYVALMAHEDDRLDPTGMIGALANKRTPWKSHGITEGTAWMSAFATQLKSEHVDSDYIPAPDRFLFDDEPRDFFQDPDFAVDIAHFGNVVDYWDFLKNDDRFETEELPGFGGQTMAELWDAVHPGIDDPTELLAYSWEYPGGSLANSKWVLWFREVMRQAEAGAMKVAFYDTIHESFPGAKCSDYDRSMRFDRGNGGHNVYLEGTQIGAQGFGLAWDAESDLQAPTLYPQGTTYHYRSEFCPDPYVLTNDFENTLVWCPIEPTDEYSLRLSRYKLDAITNSFGGAYAGSWSGSVFNSTVTPWIPLPGQAFYRTGLNTTIINCSETVTFAGTYGAGVREIATCDATRRTLAEVRAHGSSEINVWNDNRFGLNTTVGITNPSEEYSVLTYLNESLNPEKSNSYSRLARMVDQVWGFEVYWPNVTAGSILGGPTNADSKLKYSFGDPLTIIPGGSGTYRTNVQTTFTNAYSPLHGNPDYLRVNVEAASTSNTILHVEIKNFTLNSWTSIDLDPADGGNDPVDGVPMTGGTTGIGEVPAAPGPIRRVSGRIAVSSDYFGSFGEVIVRTATEALTSTSGTNYVYYDLVQVIAEDDVEFSPADLNTDGVVDESDLDYWLYLLWATELPHGSQGIVHSILDFDRSGGYSSADDDAFYTQYVLDED